jgi:hypothetical protein
MADQSHREEMNAAIRAQRERQAAPRTIGTERSADTEPPAQAERPKSLFERLRGK